MLQGDTPVDAESRAKALQVVRGAMSLLNMVAAVLPDAAADQLEVLLQVGLTPACHVARAQMSCVAPVHAYESQHILEHCDGSVLQAVKHAVIATLIPYCVLFRKMGADLLLMSTCKNFHP